MWIRNAINSIYARFGGATDGNAVLNDGTITTANAGSANTTKSDGKIGKVSTALEKQTFRRALSFPHFSKVWIETQGVAATASGSVNSNQWQNASHLGQVLASTAGIGRFIPASQDATPGYFPHHSTGLQYINWDKSWSLCIRSSHRIATQAGANNSGRFTFIVGNPIVSPTPGAGHFLDAKGVSIKMLGTNGTTGTMDVWISAHNGSTETPSSTYTFTVTSGAVSLYDFELTYIAGVGLYLYANDILICSLTTDLPSGASTANHHRIGWLFENIAAGASAACTSYTQSLMVYRDS